MVYGRRLLHMGIQMTYGFEYFSLDVDPETAVEMNGRIDRETGVRHAVGNVVRVPAFKLDARHMVSGCETMSAVLRRGGD